MPGADPSADLGKFLSEVWPRLQFPTAVDSDKIGVVNAAFPFTPASIESVRHDQELATFQTAFSRVLPHAGFVLL
jgi:hypothetical protein